MVADDTAKRGEDVQHCTYSEQRDAVVWTMNKSAKSVSKYVINIDSDSRLTNQEGVKA